MICAQALAAVLLANDVSATTGASPNHSAGRDISGALPGRTAAIQKEQISTDSGRSCNRNRGGTHFGAVERLLAIIAWFVLFPTLIVAFGFAFAVIVLLCQR